MLSSFVVKRKQEDICGFGVPELNKVGVACVTAGPGATNALPGLAEAYVDSSPIVILSGQVDYKQTTHSTNSKTIRSIVAAIPFSVSIFGLVIK